MLKEPRRRHSCMGKGGIGGAGKLAALSVAVSNSHAICADEGYLDRSMNANRF